MLHHLVHHHRCQAQQSRLHHLPYPLENHQPQLLLLLHPLLQFQLRHLHLHLHLQPGHLPQRLRDLPLHHHHRRRLLQPQHRSHLTEPLLHQ